MLPLLRRLLLLPFMSVASPATVAFHSEVADSATASLIVAVTQTACRALVNTSASPKYMGDSSIIHYCDFVA